MNVESPRSLLWVFSWTAAWLVGNVRSILTVISVGVVLNLMPDYCEYGRATAGLPRTIFFGEWFHYGNLAYNAAVWSGLAIGWCVWRQLRESEQNRYFQIRLIDIAFVTAIFAAAVAYWVDLQNEAEHGQKLLALSNRKRNLNNLTIDVPWFFDFNLKHSRSSAMKPLKSGCRIVQFTVPSPHLVDLSIAEQSQIFDHLSHLQNLQFLSLYNRDTTPAMTARLQKMRSLFFLRLEVQSEAGAHLEQAAQIPNLRAVHLVCDTLTDDDLAPLQTMPYLRDLTIEGAQEFHGDRLPHFRQLRSLRLYKVCWNDELFRQVGMMESLTSLTLSDLSGDENISPKDWECLAKLQHLETLQIFDCETVGE